MNRLRSWFLRFGGLFQKSRHERELSAELESHLQMHIEDNLRRGMSRDEARREALMKLGGVEQTKETVRDRRSLPVLETLFQDLRFAGRVLQKNPGFTFLAVMIMALGIGANTAMFSVVNAVLLRPLAFNNPDRIVILSSLWKQGGHHGQVSSLDFHDWHDQSKAFDAMAYYQDVDAAVTADRVAQYGHVSMVTPEFLRVFQVEPVAGREFSADEMKIGSSGAALISSSYSAMHFSSNSDALGKHIRLGDRTLDVVGVLPPGFRFPNKTDIWFPANTIYQETPSRSGHNYRVVGRLKPDVTLKAAQAQMTAIGTRLEEKYPDSNKNKNVAVALVRDEMVGNFRLTLYVMLAAVGLVLLIACANLANMLLAKSVARTREVAVRAAIGATRNRILRQLLTESVVLALLAGTCGVLLAVWGARILVALAPADVPRLNETGIDARALVFALAASVLASLLFGLAPALQVLRVDLNESLKQGTTRALGGGFADRLRGILVVGEIALSLVLLTGAGLFIKSFLALQNVALGFRPEHILVVETNAPSADLETAKRASRFYKNLLPQLRALPGVEGAGATLGLPGDPASDGTYWIEHLPEVLALNDHQAVFSLVAPDTFHTLGIPLKQGRDFNESDVFDAPFTVIINEALAKAAFPGQDPIGHTLFCGFDAVDSPMRIVGIVGNIRQWGPAREPSPELFMPYEQHPFPATRLHLLIRTTLAPTMLSETVRKMANDTSADVPLKFTTLEATLAENVATPRFRTLLLGIFAALAVCLAMAGVYGVMSYVVGQRANEIGLRMALGASPGDVLRLILTQALTLAGTGIVIGLAGAFAMTQLLASMLFGVTASDPATYVAVVGLIAIVALVASYVPARRAAQVDPIVALRYE